MNTAQLLHLTTGCRVLHTPTGDRAIVAAPAEPTRTYGWRVALQTTKREAHRRSSYITPMNIGDWEIDHL